jgi:hypothetical protein
MFTALELRQQLAFALDAEGSDHYRDEEDYIPAINASMKWLTTVVNAALGQNKIGEEFFREISYSGVFQTSDTSRISLNVFPNEVWTVLAVYPKPETEVIAGMPTPPTPNVKQSYHLDNLLHVASDLDCKRLSIEEWARNRRNPFEDGYEGDAICDELKRYAYLSPINYSGTSSGALSQEIEIRPKLENEKATVFWAKRPTEITSINDIVEFPNSCFQLLFDKALNYISYKQGDGTNLNSISNQDIQQLITAL